MRAGNGAGKFGGSMATGGEKTAYAGVVFRVNPKTGERIYYIRYRRGGRGSKEISEPVGKSGAGMTAAKAARIRADRIRGKEASNREQRQAAKLAKERGIGPVTFGQLWKLYEESHGEQASFPADQSRFRRYLEPVLGNREAETLTTVDVDTLRTRLINKNCSPQSVKHILALVRRLLRFGAKRALCTYPAGLIFEMPLVSNQKTENFSDAQLAAYLKALEEDADRLGAAFLKLALFTGIRRGALLALRWSDIDLENGMILLRAETAKNRRVSHIPLNQTARDILSGIPQEGEYVFPGKDGKPRENFRRTACRIRARAGLPADFRPIHSLRHVFASLLVNKGVDLYAVKELLTHSNIAMTQRYSHLRNATLKQATEYADAVLESIQDDNK